MGNENITASPSGAFRTGEGLLNIAANKQEQFEALLRVIGREELAHDPRFVHREGRLAHRYALKAEIEAALAAHSAAHWWPLLTNAGVPAGPVYTVQQALDHPQVADRGVGRDIRLLRTGVKLDGAAPGVTSPPATLGQHTREILAELGYDEAGIETLAREGAI
jgi:formyl-CoA transferase